MNGKRRFSTELAYLCGIFILAVDTVFMEKADYGMSMVVAPAYLIYLTRREQEIPRFYKRWDELRETRRFC